MKVKIYTRTGDDGTTSLYGGKRVEKHNLQVVAYGTIDELNSALGVLISFLPKSQDEICEFFQIVQNDLFTIGSFLSGNKKIDLGSIGKRVGEMEKLIDAFDKSLPVLKNFILPGGSVAASHAHITRSVCRRAERLLVILLDAEPVDHKVLQYINRLSDLFFQLARFINKQAQVEETKWQGIKRPVKK